MKKVKIMPCTQCVMESIVPFKKYYGLKFHELPQHYLNWVVENTDYMWVAFESIYHNKGHDPLYYPDVILARLKDEEFEIEDLSNIVDTSNVTHREQE